MKKFFDLIGLEMILFFAGIAGGITSLTKKPKEMTRGQKIITVLAGGFAANYLTPLLGDWLDLTDKSLYGIAFLLGYSGLKSVELFIQKLHTKLDDEQGKKN
ncbi:hypothetical protein [Flavobacterium sp. NKUCC04_CG]|uniref:hypothetical protein n=1 Tax=Flavobacterium sp. NKUCC04_CG TaxID=2842121 RepID=UPI001C5AA569|nr:hypothetical protein [Flavobacterium sp. NKUCC04_CG]MBW3519522.1 hypothetical protein [Flavobacterium sp. NKUCC04_CG]